jgi:hypothetical protein
VGPVSAPPTTTQAAVSGAAGDLNNTGRCDFACWAAPSTSVVSATATSGLPAVGSLSLPAQAAVTGGTTSSLSFSNTAAPDRALYYRQSPTDLALDPTQPLVSVATGAASVSGCGGGGSGSAVGRGYVTSTGTNVSACAETATSTISLFPRPSLPPVLKLTLTYATLSCGVNTASNIRTPTASASYKVQVDVAGANGNVSKTLTETSSNSELQGLLSTPISNGRTLADYVKTWTLGSVAKSTAVNTTARASLPSVLSLVSQPMRTVQPYSTDPTTTTTYTADDASGVTVTLGSASCLTMDAR